MNNNVKALKSSIWYTISIFLTSGVGFFTTPIFTRLLSQKEYGLYNNYASWSSIVFIVVTLNLQTTLISARYDHENHFDDYIFSCLALSFVSTVAWAIIFNVFADYFLKFLGISRFHLNVMFVYLLFIAPVTMFQTRERYSYEYKKTVLISVVLSIGTALLSVILVVVMPNKLTGRILGASLPAIIIGIFVILYFILNRKKVIISYWKYALLICIPYIPHAFSLTLLNSMDRVMINKWCGAEQTAFYSLAYSCSVIVTMLLTALNSAFAPWLGEKLALKKYEEIKYFSKKYIWLFFYLAVGIMLLAPELMLILGGRSYIDAMYVLPPVIMGSVCQFLYTLFVNVEQFSKKTGWMAIATVLAASMNYILNFILIPRFGYIAAAYTTLISYLFLLLEHMYLVYSIKLNVVYSYKTVSMAVLTGLIITVLINVLYSHDFVRYLIIVLYATIIIVVYIKYKEILLELYRNT